MRLEIAGEQLGRGGALPAIEPGEARLERGVGEIALGLVAPGLDEAGDRKPGRADELGAIPAR